MQLRLVKVPFPTLAGALLAVIACSAGAAAVSPPPPGASGAAALKARYERIRDQLDHSPFGRPIHLASREGDGELRGDVYAVVPQPYGRVATLEQAPHWCEILMLPFNTKRCTTEASDAGQDLSIYIGRRADPDAGRAYRIDFHYLVAARGDDFLQVALRAPTGPLGTRDYRIVLEALPLDARRSLIHLSYGYGYGTLSRVAMQAYLATAGANKVGFTVEGRGADGKPAFVGGMRGVMERNTMRYFLAIEAYLDSLSEPAALRVHKRLGEWFDASERYPRQLHEMERGEYLAMKERELAPGAGCCRVAGSPTGS